MIKWQGYTWEQKEHWGIVHLKNPIMYTDDSCSYIRDENLILATKYKPYIFKPLSKEILWARGLAMCMDKFHFGTYEITATLPKGKWLWPAIWLYGQEGWPPEIDIMEGYTTWFGSYFNLSTSSFRAFFRSLTQPYKVEGNYHTGIYGGIGTDRVKLGYFLDLTKPIVFEMIWMPDGITLKANGIIYSKLRGDVMRFFQKPMRFLLSIAVRKDSHYVSESEFVIHEFNYKSLK
jgi:hypothetical protein